MLVTNKKVSSKFFPIPRKKLRNVVVTNASDKDRNNRTHLVDEKQLGL